MIPRSLILGIDASPKRIGWAAVDYDTAEHITSGVHTITEPDDLKHRRSIVKDIAHAATARGDVCAAFVEDAYAGPNHHITLLHAMSVGNVEAFLLERWPLILVDRIQASTWRMVLGLPRTGKQAPLEYAQTRTTKQLNSQDEADAICIATAANHLVWEASRAEDAS